MTDNRSSYGRDPWTHHVLALGAVLVVMVAFFALLFVAPPEANRDAVNLILGALLTVGFTSVYNFYFGSSQGAKDNRDQLNKTQDKLAETAAAVAVAAAPAVAGVTSDGTVTLAPGESVKVDAVTAEPDDGELPPEQRVQL